MQTSRRMFPWDAVLALLAAAVTAGCRSDAGPSPPATRGTTGTAAEVPEPSPAATIRLTSSAFADGQPIPARYTEDGEDVSPPLSWDDVPQGTRQLALICDDPDAPSPSRPAPKPWVHWVIYNIPPDTRSLPEGVPRQAQLSEPAGATQGVNSWPSNNIGYRGPAPPPGSGTHRYFFKLYALDTELTLQPGATKDDLLKAMEGHVIGKGQLIGTYQR